MKFRFSLEPVLKHRQRLEEQAQQAYIEARQAAELVLGEIKSMYQQIDDTRKEIQEKAATQTSSSSLSLLTDFIEGQKIRIERHRLKARELLTIAEQKHEDLIQAAREHLALQKLRDMRMREFQKAQKTKERKQIDEMNTTRAPRGDVQ